MKQSIPSKYGNDRNSSRRNALMAHPASRVSSLSKARRTLLAIRDCNFLKTVVSRPTRRPEARPRRGAPSSSVASRVGITLALFFAVAIERHDNGRTSHGDAGAQGCRLAVGSFMPYLPQPGTLRHQAQQFLLGPITGTVVDIHHSEGTTFQCRGDLCNERRDVAGFVLERNDHRHGRIVPVVFRHAGSL